VLGALALWSSGGSEQASVAQTRSALRAQGFKTELSDFDFSAPDDLRARAAALTHGEFQGPGFRDPAYGWSYRGRMELPDLTKAIGNDAALVVWQQDKLPSPLDDYPTWRRPGEGHDLWNVMEERVAEDAADLDAACAAALAGPFRFNLQASRGSFMLLPHLAALRALAQLLGTRAMLDLHHSDRDRAWTNLMASTRLVTGWQTEPTEISLIMRDGLAGFVYGTTWQVLQAGGWSDERLAALQREWESVDFLKALPETAAFDRASSTALCRLYRQQPMSSPGIKIGDLMKSPRVAWYTTYAYWREMRYRNHGTYEDEKALLLFYRDRELELRRAVQAPNWMEMRTLPGVTNAVFFQSKYPSRLSAMMNFRQMGIRITGGGQGGLSRAAEAEARRRLLVTAIALERYRGRHGSYPPSLQALVPTLLPSAPIDFMDGQPLRYRTAGDGHFVLYSVGLDCVDNGGKMESPQGRGEQFGFEMRLGPREKADLVWPRLATATEARAQQDEDERQAARRQADLEQRMEESEREMEADRRAKLEKLLAQAEAAQGAERPSASAASDPVHKGQRLSKLLRNPRTAGTNELSLQDMLTLRPAASQADSGMAVFELPISYEATTNAGHIHLLVDGGLDLSSRGEEGDRQTCERATNGNCLLGWTSTYDPPGKHVIQAEFICTTDSEREDDATNVQGPPVIYVSTNLVQFNPIYDHFDERGATLYAKLPESNGVYSIELLSPKGTRITTLTGSTSNGVINAHWNLLDEHGQRYTESEFDSIFSVTLPASGRSQRVKGP